ncbi:MAG: hypothetical protein HYU37_13340 [Acidobacteria bacterium]|nr:hypothetical protein [Acidobacteriota bacterium]
MRSLTLVGAILAIFVGAHEFASAMRLPTFEIASMRLLKRLTLIIRDGVVEHVFYPVFPPDRDAQEVLAWLAAHPVGSVRRP